MQKRNQCGRHKEHPRTLTYRSWDAVVQRCTNPRASGFAEYGGAGVTMHPPWRESFANFLADMGERPPGTSLDRYPNGSGNYEPGNCRWATPREQTINRRGTSRWLELNGEKLILSDWATRIGISVPGLIQRLRRMPVEQALTQPVKK